MNKITKRLLAIASALLIGVSAIPNMGADKAVAAEKKKVSYTTSKKYTFDETYNWGYYTEPEEDGDYQLLVIIHGSGKNGCSWLKNAMPSNMEKWINKGYIEPMVVAMPWITQKLDEKWGIQDHKKFVKNGYIETLGKNFSEKSSKVDTSKTVAVTGYSMGGSDALGAGALYPDTFKDIGGLSSSWTFYKEGADGAIASKKSDINFTKDKDAHIFVSYGTGENYEFKNNAVNYKNVIDEKLGKGTTQLYAGDKSWGAHGATTLWDREIFCFIYYIQHDELPTAEMIEDACGDSPAESTVITTEAAKKAPEINSVKLSLSDGLEGTVKIGQDYTISVKASGEGLSYQWEWSENGIDYKTSTAPGYDADTVHLVGKENRPIIYYRCKVSNSTGYVVSDPVVITHEKEVTTEAPKKNTDITVSIKVNELKVKYDQPFDVSVDAAGDDLNYKWQYSTDGKEWKDSIYANDSATLNVEKATRNVYYRCIVSNSVKEIISDTITVYVEPVINSISSTVKDGKVAVGDPYSITVDAKGIGLTYQWQYSTDGKEWKDSIESGNTTNVLELTGNKYVDRIFYRCKVTSVCTSVYTDTLTFVH